MRARWHGASGFTIMDVLVAILVMTIGVAGLLAMQMTSVNANARAREILEATQLCQEKIEALRWSAMPLPAPPAGGEIIDSRGCVLGPVADTRAYCNPLLGNNSPPGPRYARTWRVDPGQSDRYEVITCWVSPTSCNLSCPAVPAPLPAHPTPGCQLHAVRLSYVR